MRWNEGEGGVPVFGSALAPHGDLALVYRRTLPMPWDADVRKLRVQFSAHPSARPSHVVEEVETRGFFHKQGEKETALFLFSNRSKTLSKACIPEVASRANT